MSASSRERRLWWLIFLVSGLFLLWRAVLPGGPGMARMYVKPAVVEGEGAAGEWVAARPNEPGALISPARTIGVWVAALLTLAIFSFLYKDNPAYRLAEAVMVGVSAAYFMVAGFWDGLVPKLFVPLSRMQWGTGADVGRSLLTLTPLVLGGMLLWRLLPKGGWIARWPLAFIVGTYAGIRLLSFLEADFVSQIRNTIVPLLVRNPDGLGFDLWASVRNGLMLGGVLSCLAYFFFSLDHRGAYGRVARVGVWYLMITFGASFAFTVMGRIALLAARLEFLFDDWLWLIDPLGKRPPPGA
jgi:hypothetical protein